MPDLNHTADQWTGDSAGIRPVTALQEPIQVLFCCDENYFQHLAVAITSLLSNNQHHRINITVVSNHCGMEVKLKLLQSVKQYFGCTLDFLEFSMESYSDFYTSGHINIFSYMRIFCSDILPKEMDKVLYLDSDLVVVGDLEELWQTDLGSNALAAVPEPWCQVRCASLGIPSEALYFNAGVLLINLKLWRDQNVRERLVECILERGSDLIFHDQDALNIVLSRSVLYLPVKWNCFAYLHRLFWSRYWRQFQSLRRAAPHAAIIHYNSPEKPWIFGCTVPRRALYYHYLRKTAWRDYKCFQGQWRQVPNYLVALLLYGLGIHRQSAERVVARLRRLLPGRCAPRSGI
jgi:lipopolysaccharide biosynthesis glycosyltransferase